ncbi:Glycoside hydrolase family 18 protein [Mycena kentingensis (nom. inval.)]|nr:Glycoside hydrolase family 18 protein [Mycena kentingensis (nom. inval.)]
MSSVEGLADTRSWIAHKTPSLRVTAGHTTRSSPRPHIVYKFTLDYDGVIETIEKRYSEFTALHAALGITDFGLPRKRLLVTTFLPSAWVDDVLINERKAGLESWLVNLLKVADYRHNEIVKNFLASAVPMVPLQEFELEDALPSTLSRKTAEELVAAVAAAKPLAAAYYPSWTMYTHTPEKLDYSKFDVLFFAFAIPDTSAKLTWDADAPAFLKQLVSSAKKSGKGTKVVLSVGGWTGSATFHQIAASSSLRGKFVSNLVKVVSDYALDGIDLDWEYPNSTGNGNPYGPADAANFLLLLKALRKALGASKIISVAVTDLPWLGANGQPLKDVSEYAAQLTYVNLMNYDINGGWGEPGPNAPLSNNGNKSSQPAYTAQAAVKQWTAAKCPASKLMLGLPLYGYVFKSSRTTLANFVDVVGEEVVEADVVEEEPLPGPMRGGNRRIVVPEDPVESDVAETEYEESEATATEAEDKEALLVDVGSEDMGEIKSEPVGETPVETPVKDKEEETETQAVANLSKWWGQAIPFNSLVASGALVKKADGTYGPGSGYTLSHDECSDTPFLYSKSRTTIVSFDDTHSLADKATFAKSKGLAGCFTWSLDQDDGLTLQNAIRNALGK